MGAVALVFDEAMRDQVSEDIMDVVVETNVICMYINSN